MTTLERRSGTLSGRGFRTFLASFYLRFHMALLLGGTALVGVLANRLLLSLGVLGPAVRFPLGVVIAYAAFFVLVRAWLGYVAAQLPTTRAHAVPQGHNLDLTPRLEDAEAIQVVHDVVHAVDPDARTSGPDLDFDLEGVALLIVGAVAIAALGVGAYLLWQGPVILIEAAFEMALTTGLVRAARRFDQPGWVGSVLRATTWPFLATLAVAIGIGLYMEATCPGVSTLTIAVEQCFG